MRRNQLICFSALCALAICRLSHAWPIVTDADIADAQAKAAVADAAKEAAVSKLSLIVDGLKTAFQADPEYVKAQTESTASVAALDAARAKVMNALKTGGEYIAAEKNRDDAAKAVSDARKAGQSDLADLATASLDARSSVSKMETAALATDADFTTAKKRVAAAAAAIKVLDSRFEVLKATNKDYQAARVEVATTTAADKAAQTTVGADLDAKHAQDVAAANAQAARNAAANPPTHTYINVNR